MRQISATDYNKFLESEEGKIFANLGKTKETLESEFKMIEHFIKTNSLENEFITLIQENNINSIEELYLSDLTTIYKIYKNFTTNRAKWGNNN